MVRKKAPEMVKKVRTHGDLSGNFKYRAARQDKDRNKSRIRYLGKMIKTARIISDQSGANEVGLGNRMSIYTPDDDETERYRLITIARGNSPQGLVSIDSPLGKAIKGHKVEEWVHAKVDDRFGYKVEIRSIDKTATDEDDKLRNF